MTFSSSCLSLSGYLSSCVLSQWRCVYACLSVWLCESVCVIERAGDYERREECIDILCKFANSVHMYSFRNGTHIHSKAISDVQAHFTLGSSLEAEAFLSQPTRHLFSLFMWRTWALYTIYTLLKFSLDSLCPLDERLFLRINLWGLFWYVKKKKKRKGRILNHCKSYSYVVLYGNRSSSPPKQVLFVLSKALMWDKELLSCEGKLLNDGCQKRLQ